MENMENVESVNVDVFVNKINEYLKNTYELTFDGILEIQDFCRGILTPLSCYAHFENEPLSRIETIRKDLAISAKNGETIKNRVKFSLSCNRNKSDFNIPLVRKAGGLLFVIEESNVGQRVVCRLMCEFTQEMKHIQTTDDLNLVDYKIYPIRDGTVVNMYWDSDYWYSVNKEGKTVYDKGQWLFSTRRNPDIQEVVWRGYKYRNLINSLLSLYPEFNLEKLPKIGKDGKPIFYTFGIKHPAIHPFLQYKIWDENTNLNEKFDKQHYQAEIWMIQPEESVMGIPYHKPLNTTNSEIKSHMSKDNTMLFITWMSENENFKHLNKRQPDNLFLGLILRHKNNGTDLLIQSDLWNNVKNILYKAKYIKGDRKVSRYVDLGLRTMEHLSIINFMNYDQNAVILFFRLFPNYFHYAIRYQTAIKLALLMLSGKQNVYSPNKEALQIAQALYEKYKSEFITTDKSGAKKWFIIKRLKHTDNTQLYLI